MRPREGEFGRLFLVRNVSTFLVDCLVFDLLIKCAAYFDPASEGRAERVQRLKEEKEKGAGGEVNGQSKDTNGDLTPA